jgi:hypothetical protein
MMKTAVIKVLLLFDPKRDEVIGGWRKLRNVELHKFTVRQV